MALTGTAQGLIYQAFRHCGQMRAGYTPSPELLDDALTEWQLMFDSFNARRTMAFTVPDFIYNVTGPGSAALTTGQILGMGFTIGIPFNFSATLNSGSAVLAVASTIGLEINQAISGAGIPAGARITAIIPNSSVTMNQSATITGASSLLVTPDFVGPRPEAIVRANLWMTSTSPGTPTRIPLSPLGAEEWANISVLQLTPIDVTTVYYYEPRYPHGVIWVWPPLSGNSIEIFTWGALAPPQSLTSTYFAPPGYKDVIVYELAKRLYNLCPNEMLVSRRSIQLLRADAEIAKRAVRDVNAPMPRMINDFRPGRPMGSATSDWDLLLAGIPY